MHFEQANEMREIASKLEDEIEKTQRQRMNSEWATSIYRLSEQNINVIKCNGK